MSPLPQKMICEAMGGAESLVTGVVNSQLGGQVGQLAQGGINQLQNNPNQFVQVTIYTISWGQGIRLMVFSPTRSSNTIFLHVLLQTQLRPNSPFVQAATAQLPGGGQQFLQNGQQVTAELEK